MLSILNATEMIPDRLTIRMFGAFHAARGEDVLTENLKRSRQLEGLLKYLLAYRGRFTAPEELVDALWEGKDCPNPAKAIQNLVYRLRAMLDRPGEPGHILFANGGYGWNIQAAYWLDLEEFDRLQEEALRGRRTGEAQPEKLSAALDLYQADFLSNASYELWTVPLRQSYRARFTACVEALISLYKAEERFGDIIALCERVTTIDPYDEKVHVSYLEALMATNRIAHARMHYSYITEMLYRDLGASPSAELREIYARINGSVRYVQHDMDSILSSFTEDRHYPDGPFFCDDEVFHELFKLERRRLLRNGQSNCLLLYTFSNASYGMPPPDVLKAARKALNTVLMQSLRKGDVVCNWNDAQVLILLVGLTFEDAELICRRIITRFHKEYEGTPLMLQKRISPVRAEVV